MRLQHGAVVAVITLALLAPAGAGASTHVQYGVQDDAWLLYGPESPAQRIQILQRLGVDIVRLTLRWDAVAAAAPADARNPDDPAYNWGLYEPMLERLHAAHIAVLISLWGTPAWANEGEKPNYLPTDGSAFASFAYAAATKYPWITRWTVWNEPNVRLFLIPNDPRLYTTRLLNPAYRALKSANPQNLVAGGVTSPRKTPSGVSPIAWIRGMRSARALLDAYAQNPYPVRPNETPASGGCWKCTEITMATLPKLITEVQSPFRGENENLADRVRLQLEAAEQVARRLEHAAGPLCRRGSAARLSRLQGRSLDPLSRPRRAEREQVDERLPHESRQGEAVVLGVRASLRAGLATGQPHERMGPGAAAVGRPAVPAPAVPPGTLAVGRRNALDDAWRLPAPHRHRRTRRAFACLVAARSSLQRDPHDQVAGRTTA